MHTRPKRAFTLIEVVVVLAILAGLLFPFLAYFRMRSVPVPPPPVPTVRRIGAALQKYLPGHHRAAPAQPGRVPQVETTSASPR